MPKLMSYHFSLGNSTDGPIGFCARVNANSRANAARILKERLEEFTSDLSLSVQEMQSTGEYIEVYFNPDAISAKDIDESEAP